MNIAAATRVRTATDGRSRGDGCSAGAPSQLGRDRHAPAPGGPDLRRRLIELDAGCLAFAWSIAFALGSFEGRIATPPILLVGETVLLSALGVALIAALRLFRSRVSSDRSVALERFALVSVALAGVCWGLERLVTPHPSMWTPAVGGILTFLGLATANACFDAWVTLQRRNGSISRPVLLVGHDGELVGLCQLLSGHPELGYRAVGYLSDTPSSAPELSTVRWLGPSERCAEGVQATRATGAIIAANGMSSTELNSVVRDLHRVGAHVHLSSGLFRIGRRRVRALPLAHEPLFYLEPSQPRRVELILKRTMDIVGAAVILVVTSPITLFCAALIRIFDGKPVLFRQVRVGQHGEQIVIRKFRTMTTGAEQQTEALRDLNIRSGPLFKIDNDPRVTRLGRWLRASSIDELPQLLNVLDGTLSLVGPRPALPSEVAEFDDELLERQMIRPGLTGLWQVEARHNTSFYAYRHLDLFYLENWCLALDFAILVATAQSLLADLLDGVARARQQRDERHRVHIDAATTAPTHATTEPSASPKATTPVGASAMGFSAATVDRREELANRMRAS